MMSNDFLLNSVRTRRLALGWSQQELADRTGLSRAGVGAIESGRLAPSVHAALALAKVLEATVEELFGSAHPRPTPIPLAVPSSLDHPRYWFASLGNQFLAYPVSEDTTQLDWHDSIEVPAILSSADQERAEQTLVVAGCDPAAHLLAMEYHRQFHFRMIFLRRNSRESLKLLTESKVHVAGVHLGHAQERNANRRAARHLLGKSAHLVHVAKWEEGIAVHPSCDAQNLRKLLRTETRWIGREEGSGARQLQDEVLGTSLTPHLVAHDHRMVAAAIKCRWADAGPCVRSVSDEAGLRFLGLQHKNYDFCFHGDLAADPRISALLAVLRSRRFRTKLAELPGYQTDQTGEAVS